MAYVPFLLASRHLRNRAALMNEDKALQGYLSLLLAVGLRCITYRSHCEAEKKVAICAFITAPALQKTCVTDEKTFCISGTARFLFAEQGNICVRGNFWHPKLQVQKAGKAEYC